MVLAENPYEQMWQALERWGLAPTGIGNQKGSAGQLGTWRALRRCTS